MGSCRIIILRDDYAEEGVPQWNLFLAPRRVKEETPRRRVGKRHHRALPLHSSRQPCGPDPDLYHELPDFTFAA